MQVAGRQSVGRWFDSKAGMLLVGCFFKQLTA